MSEDRDMLPQTAEMELRGRVTTLEERLPIVFWTALAAEMGVLALAAIILLRRRGNAGQ